MISDNSPPPTVVLLHGLARTHRSVDLLRKFLEKQGFPTWSQTYPSRSLPLDQLAGRLADAIRTEVSGEIVAVTHSLGGILVRHMADKITFSRVVMLAPPNNGSRVAQAFAGHPLFRWFYGPVGQQMALSENWPLPQSQVGVIARDKCADLDQSGKLGDTLVRHFAARRAERRHDHRRRNQIGAPDRFCHRRRQPYMDHEPSQSP